MVRRAVDNSTLERWRALNAASLLCAISDQAKQDVSFVPRSSSSTTRWHVSVGGYDYEVLCTGPKFFETRSGVGGAGALDLVCHLWRLPFKEAVKLLRERSL